MVLGLSRKDLLFDTATFGPIVTFNLGIGLQTYSIIHHQQLGIQLDSLLFSRFQIKTNEEKWAGIILTIFIATIGIFCTMFSILLIPSIAKDATGFALVSFFAAICYGTTLGRIGSSIRTIGTPLSLQSKRHSLLDQNQKNIERADLRLYLLGHECKSANIHRENIAAQRSEFTAEMNRLIAEDTRLKDLLDNILETGPDGQEINTILILNKLISEQQQWFKETINAWNQNKLTQEVEKLRALVLLPSLSNLAETICVTQRHTIQNTLIFDKLLEKLGILATKLDSSDLIPSGPNSAEISRLNPIKSHQKFVLEMASRLYSNGNENFPWSPWWIIDLRYRLQLLQSQIDWNQLGPLAENKDDKISYYLYGFAAILVSGNALNSDELQIQRDIIEAIKNHPDSYVKEFYPKPAFFRKLRSQITSSIYSNPIDKVLKMAWVLWLTSTNTGNKSK